MFQGEVTPASWRNEDVRASLDLCLSCKGCAVDCPTHVDMATYKAEFLSHHYRRRLRPRAMYALGLIPWTARIATRIPRVSNKLLLSPHLGSFLLRAAGLTTLRRAPSFAQQSLRRMPIARSAPPADPTVVLWPDTFTNAYRPDQGAELVEVLRDLGERVVIPAERACCGRPLYDMGMLTLARRTLRGLVDVLDPYVCAGLPIIVIEPSCLAAFRDELPGLLSDDPRALRLAASVRSPAEHLLSLGRFTELVAAKPDGSARRERAVIHPHCHERAAGNTSADRAVLEALGYDVSVLDAGCCGLAGSFGFRAEHEALSRKIGNEHWLPRLRKELADGRLVVTGFSCVTQLGHLDGPPATSPVSLVRELLDGTAVLRDAVV
jgi:Fe-S oxidoreductase